MNLLKSIVALFALLASPLQAQHLTKQIEPRLQSQRAQFIAFESQLSLDPKLQRFNGIPDALKNYPLVPYLEARVFEAKFKLAAPVDQIELLAFLNTHKGAPFTRKVRQLALENRDRTQKKIDYLALFNHDEANQSIKCRALEFQLTVDAKIVEDAQLTQLWKFDNHLPSDCAFLTALMRKRNLINAQLVWQRIEMAARSGHSNLIIALAPMLPKEQAEVARFWASSAQNLTNAIKLKLPATELELSARGAAYAFARMARNNPKAAVATWPILEKKLPFNDAARGIALAPLALNRAVSFETDAQTWMMRVPELGYDDKLREWRVRVPLMKLDYAATLIALDKLSEVQKNDPRWRYLRARMLELSAKTTEANLIYAELAQETNFYGFLAADRMGLNYRLCNSSWVEDPLAEQKVKNSSALQRAFEFKQMGRDDPARREWAFAFSHFTPIEQRYAVRAANGLDWMDRGPLSLLGEIHRQHYELRFPYFERAAIEREAKHHGLDASFVAGLIRSESAWQRDVVSHANAYGLMQLIPSTAEQIARRERKLYRSARDLFQPQLNIELGTAHLAELMKHHNNRSHHMLAAYNAGPAPLARWLKRAPNHPIDLWIELVPYQETREYIARVLAFSLIYDWRLYGKAKPLSTRLGLNIEARKKTQLIPFYCNVETAPSLNKPAPTIN